MHRFEIVLTFLHETSYRLIDTLFASKRNLLRDDLPNKTNGRMIHLFIHSVDKCYTRTKTK